MDCSRLPIVYYYYILRSIQYRALQMLKHWLQTALFCSILLMRWWELWILSRAVNTTGWCQQRSWFSYIQYERKNLSYVSRGAASGVVITSSNSVIGHMLPKGMSDFWLRNEGKRLYEGKEPIGYGMARQEGMRRRELYFVVVVVASQYFVSSRVLD